MSGVSLFSFSLITFWCLSFSLVDLYDFLALSKCASFVCSCVSYCVCHVLMCHLSHVLFTSRALSRAHRHTTGREGEGRKNRTDEAEECVQRTASLGDCFRDGSECIHAKRRRPHLVRDVTTAKPGVRSRRAARRRSRPHPPGRRRVAAKKPRSPPSPRPPQSASPCTPA